MSTWTEHNNLLTRTILCKSFSDAAMLVGKIAKIADEFNHHPDVSIYDYNQLTITMTTHDVGNTVTEKDHELAKIIDTLIS